MTAPDPLLPAAGLILEGGPAAGPAAAHLAQLRGWRRVPLAEDADLDAVLAAAAPDATLIFLQSPPAPDALLDLAEQVARRRPRAALGVLVGEDASALLAAAERWEACPSPGPLEAQPAGGAESGAFWGSRMTEMDGSDPAAARAAITQPAALAWVVGHSNGLDIDAGPVTLCRRDEVPAVAADELGVFPCFHGLPCGRCRPNQPQSTPGALQARRLILITCWGMMLTDRVFSPRLTLGRGLRENPHLEALITTVRVACIDGLDLPHLYFLANSGAPFGAVANRANQLRLARGLRADFLCFGDPESRLAGVFPTQEARPGETFTPVAPDLALPLATDLAEPLVLVEGEALGVFDGARLLLSQAQGPLSFSVVDRRDLWSVEAADRLAADLGHLADYLRDLGRLTDGEEAAAALAAVEEARLQVQTSFLADLSIGAVLPADLIAEGKAEIAAALEASAKAAVGAIGAAMCRYGSVFPEHIRQLRFHRLRPTAAPRCPACDSACDADALDDRPGAAPLVSVTCRACGPIFHGDPALGLGLEVPSPAAPGPLTVTFPLVNPYPFPVPACGVAAITSFRVARRFATPPSEFTCSGLGIGEVGSTGRLDVAMEIPTGFVPGVYYLSAALVVGGRLQVFRRAQHIRRL